MLLFFLFNEAIVYFSTGSSIYLPFFIFKMKENSLSATTSFLVIFSASIVEPLIEKESIKKHSIRFINKSRARGRGK